MPDPRITYDEHLEMFGTQEQIEAWKKKQEAFKEWLKDIPIYKPEFPFTSDMTFPTRQKDKLQGGVSE